MLGFGIARGVAHELLVMLVKGHPQKNQAIISLYVH